MENKAHAMAAGIFVLAVAGLLVMLAAWLNRDTGERNAYEISTRETVTGLQAQAAVRYRGVDVGKVDEIGFDPKTPGNVLIKLAVDEKAPITRGTFATLGYQGVTGLAFIQLDDEGPPQPPLEPGNGEAPRIPLRPGLLQKLAEKGEALLEKADKAIGQVNVLLGEPNQKRVATALENIGSAAGQVTQLSKRLDNTLQNRLDPALAEASRTLQSVRRSSDEFGRTAQRLNSPDGPMDRLAEGTQALSHAADSFNASTLPRINRVTEETSRAVRRLARTAAEIGDNPQSLIYGSGELPPGPGEPGFTPPGGPR